MQCVFLTHVCCMLCKRAPYMYLTCVRSVYTCSLHMHAACSLQVYVAHAWLCSLHMRAACVCTFGDAVQCRNFYQFLLGWWGNFFLSCVIFILPKVMWTQVSCFLNHRVLSRYPVLVQDEQNTCGQMCGFCFQRPRLCMRTVLILSPLLYILGHTCVPF